MSQSRSTSNRRSPAPAASFHASAASSSPSRRSLSQKRSLPLQRGPSSSTSPSPSTTPRSASPVSSSGAARHAPTRSWEATKAGAASDTPIAHLMSPLARALQAQWRQLQQDMLSPSTLQLRHRSRSPHTTAEEDVMRVLTSIKQRAEMAVEDALHTVPYLLAFAVAPLPSVSTQVVALAALRGVLSSLPGVYGAAATHAFVEDVFLGQHQALQALSMAALVAYNSAGVEAAECSGGDRAGGATSPSGRFGEARKTRGGHKSLLSRSAAAAASEHFDKLRSTTPSHIPHANPRPTTGMNASHVGEGTVSRPLYRRVTHISLMLFNDAATLCAPVADALLSCDALLKACLASLESTATPHNTSLECARADVDQRNAEDVLRVLLTLLVSEKTQQNEAALILSSYDAPRCVYALAQSLAYCSYNARGAVREGFPDNANGSSNTNTAETLLWTALKVLGWLTRNCPSGMRPFLSETSSSSLPRFLYQMLTIPVAEIREAAALWLSALLETQAHASLNLVNSLLDVMVVSPSSPSSSGRVGGCGAGQTEEQLNGAPVSAMGALVEMLRWRGRQLHVYGVAAVVAWRWMLVSHPSRVAAALLRDSSLLATLIELILRASSATTAVANTQSTSLLLREKDAQSAMSGSSKGTAAAAAAAAQHEPPLSLPDRLTALEALHVLALSYALGTLETRARLMEQMRGGALSPTTLHRLRRTADFVLKGTAAAYYNDFPAMEVKLAEPELSDGLRRAGATVVPASAAHASAPASASMAARTSILVRLTTGAQWRQLIEESLDELMGDATAGASTALVPVQRSRSPQSTTTRRSRSPRGRHSIQPHQQPQSSLSLSYPLNLDVSASAAAAAESVAPIRVLATSSAGMTKRRVQRGAGGGEEDGSDADEDDGEHRVDIDAIISASLADGSLPLSAAASTTAVPPPPRIPRTVREATLLPTSQSSTTMRFRVVQHAESLGGLFVQDSMRTVLQLAQHYTSVAALKATAPPGISSKLTRAVQSDHSRRASLIRGRAKVSHLDTSVTDSAVSLRSNSPSAVFGSAPRFPTATHRKERNPFTPVTKAANPHRMWTIQELQREDVVLFLVRYTHLMTELPEAIAAVEDHLYYLRRQLQLCPTRDVRRRCVLNDLYMNVYPSVHLFLRYINQQARSSRGVLQLLSTLSGGTVHSGNLLEVYDAVGQCTGLEVIE